VGLESYSSDRTVRQSGGHESFIPAPVNHGWTWEDARIHTLLEEATRALVELDAFSRIVPNVDLFIRSHIVKEANASSRIEGTRTEMGEALRPEEEVAPEKRDDWREVQNYVQAMNEAIGALRRVTPVHTAVEKCARDAHTGRARAEQTARRYRRSQNWIGGATIQGAFFVPPPPPGEAPGLMSDLEKFWHNEDISVPHLIRIAISHYQFETIHPFLDGNGRIGRLLITLHLIAHGFLRRPSLYLSSYMEQHKGAYYDALTTVRATGDLGQWVRFFLVDVRDTARQGGETFEALQRLRERAEREAAQMGRKAGNARQPLTLLYRQPSVSAGGVAEHLGVTHATAMSLLRDFEERGLLEETTDQKRNRRYRFTDYFDLFAR